MFYDNPAVPPAGTRVRRSLDCDSWTNEFYFMGEMSITELTIKDSPQTGGDCTHDEGDNVCVDCYHSWAQDYRFDLVPDPGHTSYVTVTNPKPSDRVAIPIALYNALNRAAGNN